MYNFTFIGGTNNSYVFETSNEIVYEIKIDFQSNFNPFLNLIFEINAKRTKAKTV